MESRRQGIFVSRDFMALIMLLNSCSPCSKTIDALRLGGVGGIDVLTVVKARIKPTAAGINQIIFSNGTSLGWRTNNGVTP